MTHSAHPKHEDTLPSRILILQKDPELGLKIAQHLYNDRHEVLGPVSKVTSAYRLLIETTPHLAVIDGSIGGKDIARFSDTLISLGVPHIITMGDGLSLKKRIFVNGRDVLADVRVSAPLTMSVSHLLWDMHIERVLLHWLEDVVSDKNIAA